MVTILGADWPDAVTAVVAVVTAPLGVIALFQTGVALRSQNASSDIQTVLTLWERLDLHWQRFRNANGPDERQFEFGQLASYYEIACQLFKSGVLRTAASSTLKEHLAEILPRMRQNPEFARQFEELMTDDATFENIRWFCSEVSEVH